MTGEVAFFEIGVEDAERGPAFYEGLFGWEFETGPREVATESPRRTCQAACMGATRGRVPTLLPRRRHRGRARPRAELGGDVEDMDGEGDEESRRKFGRFKICRDDQGSSFGLHQPPA